MAGHHVRPAAVNAGVILLVVIAVWACSNLDGLSAGLLGAVIGLIGGAVGASVTIRTARSSHPHLILPEGDPTESAAGRDRRRWRIRISTLMLLVVIAGLASYIVADLWHRAEDARRMALERDRAVLEALTEARAAQARAQAQIPVPAGPTQ
jgi:hypothetical protein